ncbi:hypothetical protein KBY97_03360 [Synechococcus sp. ATX 2A4]|uniref:hypothetical protein n=1 Tax=Synechococcus sp. ATX 2A4 TaxID=2823727 RepID=UPI0020CB90FC|nr:hypothetical protein [Synechococcus sp. ATX 2A4]MCP9884167.1 hypothetical protein [Synechococcus sp. ATX 2A4]
MLLNLDRRPDRLALSLQGAPAGGKIQLLRFRAFDGLNPADIQQIEDQFGLRSDDFPHGAGSFSHRYSMLRILQYGVDQGWPIFTVAEGDVSLRGCFRHLKFAINALNKHQSDIFFLCGWDYQAKTSGYGHLCRVKRARCTLGTAFSVYSRQGAERLIEHSTRYPQMPLDQAVAQLTVDGALNCIGYRFNPYRQMPWLGTDVQVGATTPEDRSMLRSLKSQAKHIFQLGVNRLGL